MFLKRLTASNPGLAELAFSWHRAGIIEPDTYLIDLDMMIENASRLQEAAERYGITLYYMLKQVGRNPLIAQMIQQTGMRGAVCVDWREALVMVHAQVRLGNVGHLVQIPRTVLPVIMAARPDIMTVYSVEKAIGIGAEAEHQNFVQPIMLRVVGSDDVVYSGQRGGFRFDALEEVVERIERVPGVRIAGVCSFPCLLYSNQTNSIELQPNASTVRSAGEMLACRGYSDLQLNMPSVSCIRSVSIVAESQGTHMEPGHALTGTTPYHAAHREAEERVAYAYVSEVSHNFGHHSYCYAGGHYRRGHVQSALVGTDLEHARRTSVTAPSDESIDYCFGLDGRHRVGDTVLMCFRSQLFVTRSEVAVVSGLASGAPRLAGIFNTQGLRLR